MKGRANRENGATLCRRRRCAVLLRPPPGPAAHRAACTHHALLRSSARPFSLLIAPKWPLRSRLPLRRLQPLQHARCCFPSNLHGLVEQVTLRAPGSAPRHQLSAAAALHRRPPAFSLNRCTPPHCRSRTSFLTWTASCWTPRVRGAQRMCPRLLLRCPLAQWRRAARRFLHGRSGAAVQPVWETVYVGPQSQDDGQEGIVDAGTL